MAAGNLLGQNIDPQIDEQIKYRQLIHGAGNPENNVKRGNKVLNYLNNRNAWIKLASGVSINTEGLQKLRDLGKVQGSNYITEPEIQNLKGSGLAENLVLFNTTQRFDKASKSYVSRSGVRNDNTLINSIDKMYGGLGGNEQGLKPIPGITDISVDCLNRGSIKKATVNIKAYNKFQFGLIELLYLRLGFMVILEYGWDKYVSKIESIKDNNLSDDKVTIDNVGNTVVENDWFSSQSIAQETIYNKIKEYKNKYKGNYEGFFGIVSNFTWKLNKDNTYDITLNLTTIGSVIESLTMNVPTTSLTPTILEELKGDLTKKLDIKTTEESQTENTILNNAGSDLLNQFIATTILDFPFKDRDYCYLPNLAGSTGNGVPQNRKKIPKESSYYISFAKLLEKIEIISIPNVKNGNTTSEPLLSFDTNSVFNKCAYEVNLIPLAPSKVIFAPILEEIYLKKTTQGVIENFNKQLKPFAIEQNKVFYGQIMNCYFNLNFLSNALSSNLDDKKRLSVFKFLQTLCDAINESTGFVTNIEPAIKDNRVIYFLEQNPIKGFDAIHPLVPQTPFIVYGYNQGSSTFVKDFSFQTKITPDLASMIVLSDSNGDSTTKDINTIPFDNWNIGLTNRFSEKFEDNPNGLNELTTTESGSDNPISIEDKDIIDSFKKQVKDGSADYNNYQGYSFTYNGVKVPHFGYGKEGIDISRGGNRQKEAEQQALQALAVTAYKKQFKKTSAQKTKNTARLAEITGDPSVTIVAKAASAGDNYSSYLTNAFGGATWEFGVGKFITSKERSFTTNTRVDGERKKVTTVIPAKTTYTGKPITVQAYNAKWWFLDSNPDFTKQGQNAFRLYLDKINKLDYKDKGILSAEGFIPMELSLTIDGLGGIDIYNKITIDTRILPANYPRALKFIARGVNHKVSNNNWETQIKTISTTPTDKISGREGAAAGIKYNEVVFIPDNTTTEQGPIPPLDPNQKLRVLDKRTVAGKIVDTRTYGKYQSIDWLVSEMNINTQAKFREFFNILDAKYPGYTLRINATYRTYQRSIELKAINSSNATAGYSPHNYAYGVDLNVIDPTGKTYTKSVREPWIASGIPQIAKSLGMRWGGYFKNYVDCVHFDVTKVTSASIKNAKADNKGLPQSQWNTKNTNFV